MNTMLGEKCMYVKDTFYETAEGNETHVIRHWRRDNFFKWQKHCLAVFSYWI